MILNLWTERPTSKGFGERGPEAPGIGLGLAVSVQRPVVSHVAPVQSNVLELNAELPPSEVQRHLLCVGRARAKRRFKKVGVEQRRKLGSEILSVAETAPASPSC